MYMLPRILVWLKRFPHSRGMGIQSPFAYRFVRYVVSEHYHYYAYDDLKPQSSNAGRRIRKLCRFYFRLSNYCQPHTIVDYQPSTPLYSLYMQTGCRQSHIITITDDNFSTLESMTQPVDMARVSLKGNYTAALEHLFSLATPQTIIAIQHIRKNKQTLAVWKQLTRDPRVGISFDLYYCGVLFFDTRMYKQHYIVNF